MICVFQSQAEDQPMIPVRRRAFAFDERSSAGIAAHDVSVVGDPFRLCRFVCVFVNGRNAVFTGESCSLLDSSLFYMGSGTAEQRFSPFSLALIFTFDFAALPERRSCPEVLSRRFVPFGALNAALRRGTYPVRTVMKFSRIRCGYRNIVAKKTRPLPYIQEVGKRAEMRRFPRLWTETGRIGTEGRMLYRSK